MTSHYLVQVLHNQFLFILKMQAFQQDKQWKKGLPYCYNEHHLVRSSELALWEKHINFVVTEAWGDFASHLQEFLSAAMQYKGF